MIEKARAQIEVTPAQHDELPVLYALAAGAFSSEDGWSSRRTVAVLQRAQVFVAHDRGRPVGYVAVDTDADGWRIEQLLVAPGHERRGIGKLLLAYAEGLAISREARALRIVCEERNMPVPRSQSTAAPAGRSSGSNRRPTRSPSAATSASASTATAPPNGRANIDSQPPRDAHRREARADDG